MHSAGFNRHPSLNPAEFFGRDWRKLLDVHLPFFEKNSIWRYSRARAADEPEQGWKIHVSATILTAVEVLETVAPFLESRRAFYKAPISLEELKKLNAGIFYGYTQIGKFITVYPPNDEQSVDLAAELHRLTCKMASPTIPFESRFKAGSSVYYRYGAFILNQLKTENGDIVAAIRDGNGDWVPDLRDVGAAHPAWALNPFPVAEKHAAADESLLKKNFRILRALAQRGKGGVYQALDLSGSFPRSCLLKEGRRNGEVEWDGRDGFWRVKHEATLLHLLRTAEINVPQIYSAFEAENNCYLATEFIEGANLHDYLRKRKRRLNISRAIEFAVQLAEIIRRIHAAGWLWRDCKPANLIVAENGELRPLDFEGACLTAAPDSVSWNTLTVKSADRREELHNQTTATVDLYALGAIIYLLFEGDLPPAARDEVPAMSRRNVPPMIKNLVLKLLNPLTAKGLNAESVELKLRKLQREQQAGRI